MSTARALFLYLSVVVLDALRAEFVQTLLHIHRVLEHIVTHGAEQCCLFYLLKQVHINVLIIFIVCSIN